MKPKIAILLLILLLLSGGGDRGAQALGPTVSRRPPKLVLIVADDLG